MITPLLQETAVRIVENLGGVFVNETVKNPYAGAALAPLVGTFVRVVLSTATVPSTRASKETPHPVFFELAAQSYPEVRP